MATKNIKFKKTFDEVHVEELHFFDPFFEFVLGRGRDGVHVIVPSVVDERRERRVDLLPWWLKLFPWLLSKNYHGD